MNREGRVSLGLPFESGEGVLGMSEGSAESSNRLRHVGLSPGM